MSNKYYIITWY